MMDNNGDPLTRKIIAAAITVSKNLGNGLLESVYHACLAHELSKAGFDVVKQPTMPLIYDGMKFESAFRPDLIVNQSVIVEVKATTSTLPVHRAQLLTYMRLSGIQTGLLINFHSFPFKNGISRMSL